MPKQFRVSHQGISLGAMLIGLALSLLGKPASALGADPQPTAGPAVPMGRVERVLQTDDNWQIYITYYPAPGDREALTKEAPVIVLLHGDKGNRLVYEGARGLAPRLQALHCAVVTVDLRKHGQSTNVARVGGDSPAGGRAAEANIQASDYRNMVDFDLEAVKKFIQQQHQSKRLNMHKMGIVGAGSTAAVAAAFAAVDWNKEPYDDAPSEELRTPRGQDIRAIVFLSPPVRVKGLSMAEAVSEIRNPDWNIAFLTLYGKAIRADAKDATTIAHKLAGTSKASKDRMYLIDFNVPSHGTDLLGLKEIDAEATIGKFFARHLIDLKDSEWRDRQSRLARK